ncbi:MAG TPA: zinc ribbon domain-containing protein [Gaiellaceae bacterium]|nr:zinc ribbon domain-containing protein [Gaiellaceae bacterium]
MSAPEATSTCRTCGSTLPASARFCPECGGRVDPDPRLEAAPPPETGQVPVRVFGSPPSTLLLAAAVAVVAAAIVLFVLGSWIGGAVALAIGAALGAAYAVGAADLRASRGTTRVAAARARGRAVVEQVAAQAQLRRELLQRRGELERLAGERGGRLRALGEAVYAGDETGTARARASLRELDDRIAAKEEEMARLAERVRERVEGARLESRSTMMLEPPPGPATPEPYPPPVQEPYPPPDEGTPPTPEPVPEPYPPPDEGDPPRQP